MKNLSDLIPKSDLRYSQNKGLKFTISKKENRNPWKDLESGMGLLEAFNKLEEYSANEGQTFGIWVQNKKGIGSFQYWGSDMVDVFNSNVLNIPDLYSEFK